MPAEPIWRDGGGAFASHDITLGCASRISSKPSEDDGQRSQAGRCTTLSCSLCVLSASFLHTPTSPTFPTLAVCLPWRTCGDCPALNDAPRHRHPTAAAVPPRRPISSREGQDRAEHRALRRSPSSCAEIEAEAQRAGKAIATTHTHTNTHTYTLTSRLGPRPATSPTLARTARR